MLQPTVQERRQIAEAKASTRAAYEDEEPEEEEPEEEAPPSQPAEEPQDLYQVCSCLCNEALGH